MPPKLAAASLALAFAIDHIQDLAVQLVAFTAGLAALRELWKRWLGPILKGLISVGRRAGQMHDTLVGLDERLATEQAELREALTCRDETVDQSLLEIRRHVVAVDERNAELEASLRLLADDDAMEMRKAIAAVTRRRVRAADVLGGTPVRPEQGQ